MKKLLLILLMSCFLSHSQNMNKISFTYDAAGNQTERKWCSSCDAKNPNEIKDIADVKDSDLQKFFEGDVISYYPNPVKEELYLKWPISDEVNVKSIAIYNINGVKVKLIDNLSKTDNQVIGFSEYTTGTYLVELLYNNGEEKTIKIIKE